MMEEVHSHKLHILWVRAAYRAAVTVLQRADLCLDHTIALFSNLTLARGLNTP